MDFRREPYLWIHLAGLAVVPLGLQGVWLGLALGQPLPLPGIEPIMLLGLGLLPALWMQWQQPFDVFSLGLWSVRPSALTATQRKLLSLFSRGSQRILALVGAILMGIVVWQLYRAAPLASPVVAGLPPWRGLGLGIAIASLWLSHLFWQVPLSVLGVMRTAPAIFAQQPEFPVEEVSRSFTVPGFQGGQLFVSESTESPNASN